jgi:hypothetical protein
MLDLLNSAVALLSPFALPDPAPVMPPGFEGVTKILGIAKWVALIVAVLALIGLGAVIGINGRRGEGGEHVKSFVLILAGVLVISASTTLVGFIAGA